jgi:hypothetical protein
MNDHTIHEHCAAISHLSYNDQCSKSLQKEKVILSRVDPRRNCQEGDIRLLVSLVALHWKRPLWRLCRLDGLQSECALSGSLTTMLDHVI